MPRVDLVLLAYRKSLEWLEEARNAIAAGAPERATPLLSRTQLVISSLAAGVAGAEDEVSLNFLRLYEFISNAISQGDANDLDAARNVLRTLMAGFEAARGQAIALEIQGSIPAMGRDHVLHLTV